MEVKHCDYKIPMGDGTFKQLDARLSTIPEIVIDGKMCSIFIATNVGVSDYVITVEFEDSSHNFRHYKNGKKLPKKYKESVYTLISEHLKRFPEIRIDI